MTNDKMSKTGGMKVCDAFQSVLSGPLQFLGKAKRKPGPASAIFPSRTNLLARSLVVYTFGMFTVSIDAAVKPGTVLKRVLPDAIQTLRLTFSDATIPIRYWLDVAPPVARRPPQCPAPAAAG